VKIRIGFGTGALTGVETQESFRLLVDELERLRFDSLWVSERLAGPGPDPVVAMSMAAARTERLKFGMSVMVLPGRNPVVTAKELSSLDVLSGGRLVPAFGLGSPRLAEHQAFGVAREERAGVFDEALGLMRRLWTEDVVTHHGDRFHVDDVRLLPKPVQQPLDVWLGGIAPSELRRVGRLADGWLPSFVTPADVRAGLATIREVADAHDREIEAEHFGVLIPYVNEPIDEEALGFLRKDRPDLNIGEMVARSAQDLAPLIERFVAVGASKFVVVPFAPMADITAELEELSAVVRPLET